MSNIITYTIQDLLDLNKQLNYPSNSKLISKEFKTIPACNKFYNIIKTDKQNYLDNIKSILNKIHTTNFDKLYDKLQDIIKNDNTQINIILNIIEEYLNKPSMLDNSLECYSLVFSKLYETNYIDLEQILKFTQHIYFNKCFNKYNITNDLSSIPKDLLNTMLHKLNIIPKNNKISCDNIVDIMSNLNTITKINIKFISYLQQYIFNNKTELLDMIVNSFINNNTINNYNLYSLNMMLMNEFTNTYIKKNYLDNLYNIYDNLENFVDSNDYDSKMCEAEIEKIIYKMNKTKL